MADKVSRAMAYLEKLPVAVSGGGGHNATLRAACECFRFGLSEGEAWECLQWFNTYRCQPAWSEHELKHKLASAQAMTAKGGQVAKHLGGQRGYNRPARQFVAPPTPTKRVTVAQPVKVVMPCWDVSEAEEERRWARVAAELGYTLEEYDVRCGNEVGALV